MNTIIELLPLRYRLNSIYDDIVTDDRYALVYDAIASHKMPFWQIQNLEIWVNEQYAKLIRED